MGVLDQLQIKNISLTDPKAWDSSLWQFAGSQSEAGETVTEQTALTYSAVFNAITLISGTIASLPLHLMRNDGKNKKYATDQSLYRVMHTQYNPYMTAMAGRECLVSHILGWGNGYAEIVRDVCGDIKELWPIPPDRVKPKMNAGKLVYVIKLPDGTDIVLPREKILHVPGLGFDGFTGYSVVAMARKSIGLGMAMETFGARFFGHGTHPGMIVEHPGKLNDPSKLRDALTSIYSGLGQSHRLMLLEEGMKATKIVIDPKDSQFLESRQFQIPEIARWFNLPPHKLKDLTKSSFNNIGAEQISFVTDSILPWLIRFEGNYNIQLLTLRQEKEGFYHKHSVEGLLRGDAESRAAFYQVMLDRGVFSINEVRELEDKNPVKGGDVHLVPLNMTTLENAGGKQEPSNIEGELKDEEEPI
jgi:HK97 family phage portal protein